MGNIESNPAEASKLALDEAREQSYYTYSMIQRKWVVSPAPSQHPSPPLEPPSKPKPKSTDTDTDAPLSSTLTILTWNIDFMRPLATARMASALNHLRNLIAKCPRHIIICLQEITAEDLTLMTSARWIRSQFHLTDTTPTNWLSTYGTVTLIDRRLTPRRVFRVPYANSHMGRDALFVDVICPHAPMRILRVGNTHLESLRAEPPRRPAQVATAAGFMRENEGGALIHAAFLAGDMNAIEGFDRLLHAEQGLGDAYLARGGEEEREEGFTWGQMVPKGVRLRYGCTRMDKVWFTEVEGNVKVRGLERFGWDVEVEGDEDRRKLMRAAGIEMGWVTDHLGVRADFELSS